MKTCFIQHQILFLWIFYVLISVLCKITNLTFGKKILRHSDGGGWDAGSSYSYVPDLREEYSTVYDENGYYAQNKRVKVLQWLLLPIFGIFSVLATAGYIFTWIDYFFSNNYITEYATPEMRKKA